MALSSPQAPEVPKQTPEAQFREVLEDVADVCDALAPYCNGSTTSLVEVIRLAASSEHQLQFLHSVVIARQAQKR